MSDKRFQVFISSTYVDLETERRAVTQALMDMECIPAGMELFPAADEEQLKFIYKVIQDCDYYILIIGGRYGSIDSDGVSYTEREYDYAVSLGIPVIAFVRDAAMIDISASDHPERLVSFRDKVSTNRIAKMWKDASKLPSAVVVSLQRTIRMNPGVGWIRGDTATSIETLGELNELRKENEALKSKISKLERFEDVRNNIAPINAPIKFEIRTSHINGSSSGAITLPADEVFAKISPYLISPQQDLNVQSKLASLLNEVAKVPGLPRIDDRSFWRFRTHMEVHNYIEIINVKSAKGDLLTYWHLTPMGRAFMIRNNCVPTETN